MRITQSMLSNNMLTNISNNYERLAKLQQQITSQKKFSKPSDDPSAAMMGMTYRTNLNQVEQYSSNISEATSWTESTDSALNQAISALQRIRELAVQASNGTYEQSQRESIAAEINELKQHITDIGDTQLGAQYIFNGFNTNSRPSATLVQKSLIEIQASTAGTTKGQYKLEIASNFEVGQKVTVGGQDFEVRASTGANDGTGFKVGANIYETTSNLLEAINANTTLNSKFDTAILSAGNATAGITGSTLATDADAIILQEKVASGDDMETVVGKTNDPNANVGAPSYGTGNIQVEVFDGIKITVNTSGKVFGKALSDTGSIQKLYTALTNPNINESEITNLIGGIDETINEFIDTQAQVGAKQNRINLMNDRLSEQEVIAQKVLSNNEDVDMEKVILNFTTQESVHNAALSVGAKIIQPSLLDFLR